MSPASTSPSDHPARLRANSSAPDVRRIGWDLAAPRMWTLLLSSVLLLSAVCRAPGQGSGDESLPLPYATPAELGMALPDAPSSPGGDRRVVLATDESAEPVVARVYLQVGDHFVVLLPDGSLRSVPISRTTLTDRPFEPLDKKALAQTLTADRFNGFKTRSTRRYLYVYNSSDAFQAATSR
ncbi:MAG: hypothetical protein KDA92_00560, partial [Planctomycetales bacterium]|nr:hypothetical protein [Planctomycetales bacterium]